MRSLQEQINEIYRKIRHLKGRGTTPNQYTETQRDAIIDPVEGKVIYNSTSNTNQYWNGTDWVNESGNAVDTVTLTGNQTLTNKILTSPAINSPTGIVKFDVGLGNVDNTSDVNKPISTAQQTALNLKSDDNVVVKLTGNQTVADIKTFSSSPIVPTPTTNFQSATKKYVDDNAGLGYRVYTALLNQSGTSVPTVTELKNSLGSVVVWSRVFDGWYRGTLSSYPTVDFGFTGTSIKTYINGFSRGLGSGLMYIPILNNGGTAIIGYYSITALQDKISIFVRNETFDLVDFSVLFGNDEIFYLPEIRIY